jgi:hypothetical protein
MSHTPDGYPPATPPVPPGSSAGGYPPPGPYGAAPGAQPGGPARRSWFARHKILTTAGALVLVVGVVGALGGGAEEQGTSAPPAAAPAAGQDQAEGASTTEDAPVEETAAEEPAAEEAPATESTPGIGDTVADGKFEFVVTAVETGVAQVGDEFFNQTAQGQFVLVRMTVTNIGDQAQYFDGSSQKLLDTAGRTHSADTGAAIYLGDSESFLNQINPGNTVEGVVVFDIPADAALASLELHDSPFSGGVTVNLG